MKLIRIAGVTCAAAAMLLPAGAFAAASGADSANATTALTDRPDSGSTGPDWALDDATRKVSLTLVNHPKDSSTWVYHGVLHDDGTFTTISGAVSPQAGKPIKSVTHGAFHGGGNFDFTADHPISTHPPTSHSGTGPASTFEWYTLFFSAGTKFTANSFTDWSWTYTAKNPCNAGEPESEHWTDAYYSSGSLPSDGDITGFDKVTPCNLPTPKPSPAPGSGGTMSGGGTTGGAATGGGATGGTTSGDGTTTGSIHQVSQVPVGAANTGGGGTAASSLLPELLTGGGIAAVAAGGGMFLLRRRGARQ